MSIKSQTTVDSVLKELQVIAEKVRDLNSPLGAIKNYLEDMDEIVGDDSKELKSHLVSANNVTNKCISIVRRLVELTQNYYN